MTPSTDPSERDYRTELLPQVVTPKRRNGHGSHTRPGGSRNSMSRRIRFQFTPPVWQRRLRARCQRRPTWKPNARNARLARPPARTADVPRAFGWRFRRHAIGLIPGYLKSNVGGAADSQTKVGSVDARRPSKRSDFSPQRCAAHSAPGNSSAACNE